MEVRILSKTHINMNDEVLVSTAVVFKTRASKNVWLLVNTGEGEGWQLPKSVVRRTESSVRAALRTLSELAGIRGRVIEEMGKATAKSGRNGKSITRRTIYYLIQQRGKDLIPATAKTTWVDGRGFKGKIKSAIERKILLQSRKFLLEWQKDPTKIH